MSNITNTTNITNTENEANQALNTNSNVQFNSINTDIITGISIMTADNIIITAMNTDNSQTSMVMINGSNQLVKRTTPITISDNNLNTTDSPFFFRQTLT